MKPIRTLLLPGALLLALTLPQPVLAADQDVDKKIEALQKELDALKHKTDQVERKSLGRWLEIGGDYRFRYDYLKGKTANHFSIFDPFYAGQAAAPTLINGETVKNTTLYTNRFGLDLKAKATQNVSVTTRLLMYKVSGAQDDAAINNLNGIPFSADRAGVFDGTLGHVPTDNKLLVDRVYATWSNILDQPLWFSIGRRPSTGGVPSHLKQNREKPGNSGVPSLLVDYAFDGVTIGYAPEIDGLDGAYAKLCYGVGFENGFTNAAGNGLRDTHMVGVNLVPYDTDRFRAEFQWNRGINIFDAPQILTGPGAAFGFKPGKELGDIDWYGLSFLGTVKKLGPGRFNWFVDGGLSVTHPNGQANAFGDGLLFSAGQPAEDKTGWAVFVGGRYDIEATGTKIGAEYNHGSSNWITFTPAADDMWTSKVGTRGNVYEGYIIQELPLKPISSYFSKVFFKVGYQYYDFEYTGSNFWAGSPVKVAGLDATTPQFFIPLKNAQDLYATFEVHF